MVHLFGSRSSKIHAGGTRFALSRRMDTQPEITQLAPGPAIAIRTQLAIGELPRFFGEAFHELFAQGGSQMAGPPFARYHDIRDGRVDVEAILPLRSAIPGAGRVVALQLAGGPAVQIRHVGPYDELHATYATIEHWLADHHRDRADAVREVYLTSPGEVPDPANWVTLVIQPIRDAAQPSA
jgi:AraC family transcriptional regulator